MDNGNRDHLAERTIDLLGLADVPRWSVIKILRPQSVAEHSFAVAVLTMELISRLSIQGLTSPISLGAVLWALCHDAPETYTGDIDGLLKREYPAVKRALEVAEAEAFPWYATMRDGVGEPLLALVKVADIIESIIYLRQWGKGSRADNVCTELRHILFGYRVPALAAAIGDKGEYCIEAVCRVLDHSTLESGSYQFRRSLTFNQLGDANAGAGSGSGSGPSGPGAGSGSGSGSGRGTASAVPEQDKSED